MPGQWWLPHLFLQMDGVFLRKFLINSFSRGFPVNNLHDVEISVCKIASIINIPINLSFREKVF